MLSCGESRLVINSVICVDHTSEKSEGGGTIATDVDGKTGAVVSDEHRTVLVGGDGRHEQIQVWIGDGALFQPRLVGGADAIPLDRHSPVEFRVAGGVKHPADRKRLGAQRRIVALEHRGVVRLRRARR